MKQKVNAAIQKSTNYLNTTGTPLPSNEKCLHSRFPRFSNDNNNNYCNKKHKIKELQKTAVFRTAQILQEVLM